MFIYFFFCSAEFNAVCVNQEKFNNDKWVNRSLYAVLASVEFAGRMCLTVTVRGRGNIIDIEYYIGLYSIPFY